MAPFPFTPSARARARSTAASRRSTRSSGLSVASDVGVVAHRRAHLGARRIEEGQGHRLGEAADQAAGRVARSARAEEAPVRRDVARVGHPAQGERGDQHRDQRHAGPHRVLHPRPPPPRARGPSRRTPARRGAAGPRPQRRGARWRSAAPSPAGARSCGRPARPRRAPRRTGRTRRRRPGAPAWRARRTRAPPGPGARPAESAERFQRRHGGAGDGQYAEHVEERAERARAHHPLGEEDREQPEHRGRGEEDAPGVHRHRRASSTRVVAKSATQVTRR